MTRGERWVLLGLARPRAEWFTKLAQWVSAASFPGEFVKCVSVEEVRARLDSGRAYSALLIDLDLDAVDRDLLSAAFAARTSVIGIQGKRNKRWSPTELEFTAVLPADFGRDQLLDVLSSHAQPVGRGDQLPAAMDEPASPPWRGRLIAVCGGGGVGASTVAIAVAQASASDGRYGRRVLLADLALRADQAVLHDAPDLGPGLAELCEAHRRGRPKTAEVTAMTFDVAARGYSLLLGLRRPSAWSALRPRTIDATLDGLRQAFQMTIADVTGDFESEAECGSVEVEERNYLARATVTSADVVLAVGSPGLKGIHSLGNLITAITAAGTEASRVVPVINRSPRHPRSRSELSAALAVTAAQAGDIQGPTFLAERKVDDALRDGIALPAALTGPLHGAVETVLALHTDHAPPHSEPVRVAPGSLGGWADTNLGTS